MLWGLSEGKPRSGSEKAPGREKERVGSLAGQCAVRLQAAGGKMEGPEEPHIGWKGVEESLELWGPSTIRARTPM